MTTAGRDGMLRPRCDVPQWPERERGESRSPDHPLPSQAAGDDRSANGEAEIWPPREARLGNRAVSHICHWAVQWGWRNREMLLSATTTHIFCRREPIGSLTRRSTSTTQRSRPGGADLVSSCLAHDDSDEISWRASRFRLSPPPPLSPPPEGYRPSLSHHLSSLEGPSLVFRSPTRNTLPPSHTRSLFIVPSPPHTRPP
ncbi:hypothetical protein GGS23DRAFT_270081 [Durotheca rogersii]|uniref:uncharacterized protein n=1 Tax=Durotheca rogersii TaxID=419775 RepID=UPI002220A425|nr:uncharacterized protein GGS23DRAFT_270081 [Durotheca rogersii]KAI5866422.1 hypothetical protein GGS23DRAFT_270081 [Durotheca rogersii]